VDNSQNTDYNAWQSSFRKRFSKGISFDAHYTWGKSLGISGGDIGAYYGSDNDSNVIQDFHDIRSNRGPNVGDASHRLLADWIYELPRLAHSNSLVRGALGGWQATGVFSTRSGNRITISETCASDWFCRPDYAGGPLVVSNWKETTATRCTPGARCTVQFINKAAFTLVPVDSRTRIAVRPGNLANGILRGPASVSVDFSLSKNFKVRERMNLQIRADMFNFLNHVNYSDPSSGLNSATFGEINGAGGMRVIQLNGRISW
jgi:hypothetical protein